MRSFRTVVGAALLAATACAWGQKPYTELFRLADSYYEQLMQPYRTSHGMLRSEPPDKYDHRFDISLTKDSQVLRVAYIVMGDRAGLQLVADNNNRREVYFFNDEESADRCNTFAIDTRTKSPVGQIVENNGPECEEAAEPFMTDFIAALEEYAAQKRE